MTIGIDIQDVKEFKKPDRFFTQSERNYIAEKSPETASGIFCAKEAFFKSIGTGIQKSQLLNVEILHTESGAPYIVLHGELKEKYGTHNIQLSISHTKTTAVSVCIICS